MPPVQRQANQTPQRRLSVRALADARQKRDSAKQLLAIPVEPARFWPEQASAEAGSIEYVRAHVRDCAGT